MNYQTIYQQSIKDPKAFWMQQAASLNWFVEPKTLTTTDENEYTQWFPDGKLNMSYLCIDQHIKSGFGDQTAIVYDSPVSDQRQEISFHQLKEKVARLAGGLRDLGIKSGDTAVIYMPMIPEAIYSMLACARIGVIHSVVFGGFAPKELAIRIDDCQPKVVLTASNGIEVNKKIAYQPLVDQAISLASHSIEKVILFDREQEIDVRFDDQCVDFNSLIAQSRPLDAMPVLSTHPLYILYTSGTTGTPKGIIRDTGGYATALKYSMQHIYDVEPGECFWAASDVGWVVGHSYIAYGPLLNRNTTILFEGKPIRTPDASTFWRIIEENEVKSMFTAPTAIRAIKKEDPNGDFIKKYDLSSLRYLFLAGERCDQATLEWTGEQLQIPVIDHWWQTESGWPILANSAGVELLPIKTGSAGVSVCGYEVTILREDGSPAADNEEGLVCIKLPLPPGTLMNLWRNPKRFQAGYLDRFPGYYFSGDGGFKDADGYVYITGRVDDIINVAGHRLSTAEMEEIVAAHPLVAECAVFGVKDDLKGELPLGMVVLKNDAVNAEELEKELIQKVREEIGAVAAFKKVIPVMRLPKTRSGKILRKLLRSIANEDEYQIPSTIDDPMIAAEIEAEVKKRSMVKD
ncbi:MAG: AMP-binding protein [Cyclobacteriaceae bacterium]|nr:AMP-binding protein [Cyclobacteriaceae bacterium]MCH8516481.1 AMP-binding protein [Cyclobacteriaceae bacterium]